MPILKQEADIYPADLLENEQLLGEEGRYWWAAYTRSRREKELMRQMHRRSLPFYAPVIGKRFRSPAGRLRTSYIPLFPNYVFLFLTEVERQEAMVTNCISRVNRVEQADLLVEDLRRVQMACQLGVPLTPEARLESGDVVRVRSGHFAGYEGIVLRRESKTRLLLSVRFLEQGVSMEVDEGLLEVLK